MELSFDKILNWRGVNNGSMSGGGDSSAILWEDGSLMQWEDGSDILWES
jgi:hypothetical protein